MVPIYLRANALAALAMVVSSAQRMTSVQSVMLMHFSSRLLLMVTAFARQDSVTLLVQLDAHSVNRISMSQITLAMTVARGALRAFSLDFVRLVKTQIIS